ncbi:MAG: NYN domain-containing protein [Deinococcota bacterium]
MPTAILVDGGFFLYRYPKVYGPIDPQRPEEEAERVAKDLYQMATKHLSRKKRSQEGNEGWVRDRELYRIFFYDCPPLTKRIHNPLSKKALNLERTFTALFRNALHAKLRAMRKVALRLGYLDEGNARWEIKPDILEQLLKGKKRWEDLTLDDVYYHARQKGVDMRIGLDIASMAFKRQIDQIVLVAGDSDFVPAAKLARREGLDFILDPMWNPIRPDLHEHIDGLRSTCPRPKSRGGV